MKFPRKAEIVDPTLIVRRCLGGDERAWYQLVELYQSLVYSVAKRSGLNEDDANDVFQKSFLALYRSLSKIEDPRTLPKWLAVTASREAIRCYRVTNKTTNADDLESLMTGVEAEADRYADESVVSDGLRQSLEILGGKCQKLLTMLYIEERSYQEISDSANLPMGAIGPTRARCLDKLRKIVLKLELI